MIDFKHCPNQSPEKCPSRCPGLVAIHVCRKIAAGDREFRNLAIQRINGSQSANQISHAISMPGGKMEIITDEDYRKYSKISKSCKHFKMIRDKPCGCVGECDLEMGSSAYKPEFVKLVDCIKCIKESPENSA